MNNAAMKMAKLLATNMYLDGGNTQIVWPEFTNRSRHSTASEAWYDDGVLYTSIGGHLPGVIWRRAGVISGANAYTQTGVNTFQLATVNNAYGNAWFGSDHPDLICATQNGWNNFWNSIQPLQRYLDTESDVGKIGFQSFRFNAAEVVIDKYMPANFMFGMNTSYIEWYHSDNPRFQYGFTGFKEAQNSIDVSGQFLYAGDIVVPNPQDRFQAQRDGVISRLFSRR